MIKFLTIVTALSVCLTAYAQSDTDKSHKQGERKSPDVSNARDRPEINNSNKDMGYNSSKKRENDPEPKTKPKNDCPSCR